MTTFDGAISNLEEIRDTKGTYPPDEDSLELAADALAFAQALHGLFKDNGMTVSAEPDFDELESLVDAVFGELGAATLFLCDSRFSRYPDMLRNIGNNLAKSQDAEVVPTPVIKGFERFASRIENARLHMQNVAKTPEEIVKNE